MRSSIHVRVHLFVHVRVHLFVHVRVHLFVHVRVHLFVHVRVHLFVHVRVHLFVHVRVHLFVHVRVHLFVHVRVHPSMLHACHTVYPEILAVKKVGDFTPNRAFKNISGIFIWRQIHESRMRVTFTIARKMLAYFFGDSNIDRHIGKFN